MTTGTRKARMTISDAARRLTFCSCNLENVLSTYPRCHFLSRAGGVMFGD